MDWKERLLELSLDYGLKDKEVSQILNQEYGVTIADDTVRYYARRKNKKKEHKAALKSNGVRKTLILSDLHIPFHREEVIIDIILKHRNEIDTIIFGGDIVDCEGISKFPKENRKPLIQEMIVAYKFLKRIDKLTPDIKKILLWGNNEYRYVSYLATKGNELNPFHSDNILEEIVKGFTHHDRVQRKKTHYPPLSDNFKVINKWFYQHDDILVAHPKTFVRASLGTFIKTVTHFVKRGFKFNTLFIGHTHKWGTGTDFGVWGGELGCLCLPMEYADNGNVNYTPQEYGYALVTQVNGVTDINQSRLYKLDLEDGEPEWEEENDPS